MEQAPKSEKKEASHAASMVWEYVEDYEGLFRPDGHYTEHSSGYYISRLQNLLAPQLTNDPEAQAKAEAIFNYLSDSSHNLATLGWVGVARAHAAYSVFDVISRQEDIENPIDPMLDSFEGDMTMLEFLLTTPTAETMLDEESRILHIKNSRTK